VRNSLINTYAAAVLWILGVVLLLFTLYIGAAVCVALFHPSPQRRNDARHVLRDLLRAIRDWLR
jgi:hypothetical protein